MLPSYEITPNRWLKGVKIQFCSYYFYKIAFWSSARHFYIWEAIECTGLEQQMHMSSVSCMSNLFVLCILMFCVESHT